MVICLEQGADLHMAQLMPLPLTLSCFSKIQIGFAFLVMVMVMVNVDLYSAIITKVSNALVPAHPGSRGKKAVKRVCVYTSIPLPSLRL